MTPALDTGNPSRLGAALEWLPVLAGLLLLYVPTFYDQATWHWSRDEGSHGPVILAVMVWLVWRRREVLLEDSGPRARVAGFATAIFGLLLYVVGRSQEIAIFEVGSLAPVLAGTLLAMRGAQALRALWFPILFVAFLVPLPGLFVDALTAPLKEMVSRIAEQVLYLAGYPIARSGVVLVIGKYQLLVADACSGLNSMFSLSALGLLYMYLTARPGFVHNAVMFVSILPVAFAANVVRVLLLLLITYHMGDEAGQGFLHGATGIVLLLVALAFLVILDGVMARISAWFAPR